MHYCIVSPHFISRYITYHDYRGITNSPSTIVEILASYVSYAPVNPPNNMKASLKLVRQNDVGGAQIIVDIIFKLTKLLLTQ